MGKVNLAENLHIPVESVIPFEPMHGLKSIITRLIPLLFGNENKKHENKDMNELLNKTIRRVYNIKNDMDFFGVSQVVHNAVNKRLEELKTSPSLQGSRFVILAEQMVKSHNLSNTTTSDKLVVGFTIIPYLLQDSMDDPIVWSSVTLLSSVSCFYGFTGTGEEALYYQSIIDVSLYIMQMHVYPSFLVAYFHILTHIYDTYKDNGPMTEICAFPYEHLYLHFANWYNTGGPDRVKTEFDRIALVNTSRIIQTKNSDEAELEVVLVYEETMEYNNTYIDNILCVYMRCYINAVSDLNCCVNDNRVIMSWTDLEMSKCGVRGWLNKKYEAVDEFMGKSMDSNGWATSNADVERFYKQNGYPEETFLDGDDITFHVIDGFYWNKHQYSVIPTSVEKLEREHFNNTCFGIVKSANGRIHLFAILKYYAWVRKTKGDVYCQCLVREIPIKPLHPFLPSSHCFTVNLNEVHSSNAGITLISLHRLHVVPLAFTSSPSNNVLLTGLIFKKSLFQWNLTEKLFVKPTNDIESNSSDN